MSKLTLAVVATLSLISLAGPRGATAATQDPYPKLVTLGAEKVFAPPGFDDNDNAQLVITGNLPSTCFRTGPATATVDQTQHRIVIRNQAYYYSSCWCLYTLVPYVKVIELGIVPAGQYQVLMEDHDGKLQAFGTLPISVARSLQPDDELYALVNDIQPNAGTTPEGARTVTLSGFFTNECMDLKEVRVLYRSPDVIEVLPIAELKQEAECREIKRPFSRVVELRSPQGPLQGEKLLHVRSLNGQSLNKVFEF